jgi:dienelactone hydrolase
MRKLAVCFFFALSLTSGAQSNRCPSALDYDHAAFLEIKEAGVNRRGDVAINDISYASPKGGRVPAYLLVPDGKGPFPAVIWGHWYWSNSEFRNRREFLEEAIVLAHSGVVSLLTDGPVARPGHVDEKDPLSDQVAMDLIQSIIDMRRGADLLLARKDVDPKRLAYVGHSYNATVGGFLSGCDHRFKAFVLMAGGLSDEVDKKSEEFQKFRRSVGPEKFDAFEARYSWLDAGKFTPHAAPAAVFLQYAEQEDFLTPERAHAYAALVGGPRLFKLYDAPHALNAEARRDRIAFLVAQLSIKSPPSPAQIAAIPDLPQPPSPAR